MDVELITINTQILEKEFVIEAKHNNIANTDDDVHIFLQNNVK